MPPEALFYINSSAPTRICDNGGWTDTWYAEYGSVFNIAIDVRTFVQVAVYPANSLPGSIEISARNYGDEYIRTPDSPWQKHPLIEAAIDLVGVPSGIDVHITLFSEAPPGASIGTSASLTVALIGALNCLNGVQNQPYLVAQQAHRVETEKLDGESGIQDQLAAVFGGINFIEVDHYPTAHVTQLRPPEDVIRELERRLILVILDHPHKSSEVHEGVVAHLQESGPEDPRLEALRCTTAPARDALLRGDFTALGASFIRNTEAQRALQPSLINPTAQMIIELAEENFAVGWKVNGAGGEGGSLAVLMDESAEHAFGFMEAVESSIQCLVMKPRLAAAGLVCSYPDR